MRTGLVLILSPLLFAFFFQTRQLERPRESSGLLFDHVKHVQEEGLACDDCHSGVEESRSGADNLLPDMDVCADCHDVEDDEQCGMCHADPDNPDVAPRIVDYSEKFSHEQHLGRDLECARCHEALVVREPGPEAASLPGMLNCMDCHQESSVAVECATCHMPDDELKPGSHSSDFVHTHSFLAASDAHDSLERFSCQTCHDDTFCQECHQGDNLGRLTHPLNYQFTHSLDARGQERQCQSCHTDETFCVDCHRDNQVLPLNHRPGWVNGGDGGLHRLEATRDLNSCIACHSENAEEVCGACH